MNPNILQTVKSFSKLLDSGIKAAIDAGGLWSYLVFFIVIFLGCAFIFLSWLPSDVLIFLCGSLSGNYHLNILLVIIVGTLGAYLGNTVKYHLSKHNHKTKLPTKIKNNRLMDYFNKNSSQAVLTANLIPIIGNFIPMIAGYEKMNSTIYNRKNFEGALIWILIFALLGYISVHIPIIKHNMVLSSILISLIIGLLYQIIGKSVALVKKSAQK
ncbi:DedA family protein [Lentilactobacillus laojiaonis]|uniref:DedA family protein n=1 Tax=Lentilactobacillus laojiaonis TaxID=2883998 RepID=UPI001D0AB77D|nr:DedA family protein [Lentilactobacillus laojiaonis]UDM32229.1 DedA family protein [Lentilactobacillus laojiaonis]